MGLCNASETCVCVNQGDIKFERDRGAPIRLSCASDSVTFQNSKFWNVIINR